MLSSLALTALAEQPHKSTKLPIVSTDSKECQQIITQKVSTGLLDKIMKAVPKDRNDNVFNAIKKSGAQKINKQKITGINTDVDVSIYSKPEQIWTKILDKAIEKAKEIVDTVITTMYDNAVYKVTSMAEDAAYKALGKVTRKLGSEASYLINTAIGQIVPDAARTLRGCATNLNLECLQKVQDSIENSIARGAHDSVDAGRVIMGNKIDNKISDVYDGKFGKLGSIVDVRDVKSVVYEVTGDIYYGTKSVATEAVYKFSNGTASDAMSSFGNESLIQLYGKGR